VREKKRAGERGGGGETKTARLMSKVRALFAEEKNFSLKMTLYACTKQGSLCQKALFTKKIAGVLPIVRHRECIQKKYRGIAYGKTQRMPFISVGCLR